MKSVVFVLHMFVLCGMLDNVAGWGALFEPLKSGGHEFSSLTILRASSRQDDHENGVLATYRATLQKAYDLEYRKKAGKLYNVERVRNEYESNRPLYDIRDRGTSFQSLIEAEADDFDLSSCDGEDCDECVIPDDFKVMSGESSMDVMSFLGIRRVEPLKVMRLLGEWD